MHVVTCDPQNGVNSMPFGRGDKCILYDNVGPVQYVYTCGVTVNEVKRFSNKYVRAHAVKMRARPCTHQVPGGCPLPAWPNARGKFEFHSVTRVQ